MWAFLKASCCIHITNKTVICPSVNYLNYLNKFVHPFLNIFLLELLHDYATSHISQGAEQEWEQWGAPAPGTESTIVTAWGTSAGVGWEVGWGDLLFPGTHPCALREPCLPVWTHGRQ